MYDSFFFRAFFVSMVSLIAVYPYFARAQPSKTEIDAYARTHGYPRSDYPYYEKVNGCGAEGPTSAVPDKYESTVNRPAPTIQNPRRIKKFVIFRADFTSACNNHDRCYMTVGKDREGCNYQFNRDLLAACERPTFVENLIPNPSMHTCVTLAQTYANTVYTLGAFFYDRDQKEAKWYKSLVDNFIASRAQGRVGVKYGNNGTDNCYNWCQSPRGLGQFAGKYGICQSGKDAQTKKEVGCFVFHQRPILCTCLFP